VEEAYRSKKRQKYNLPAFPLGFFIKVVDEILEGFEDFLGWDFYSNEFF